ncbi:MAG: hemerythrin domain-containing protein [Microbacteriaceae bacterium]
MVETVEHNESEEEVGAMGILAEALEQEHHEIDGGIESFVQRLEQGTPDKKSLLRAFDALRRHIYLEETFIFPPLKAAGLMMPVFVMLREHGELWNAMDKIEALLGSEPARLEQSTINSLKHGCQELLSLLDAHNSKEEPVIYPQIDANLDPSANQELQDFLVDGTLPKAWVCEQAYSES